MHELIGGIYECALESGRLPEIGRQIERALGVESSIHFVSEGQTGRMLRLFSASPNFDPDARSDYERYYHQKNPWFQRAVSRVRSASRRGSRLVMRGEELIEEREFARTEFCADWCSRVGIYHMIGCAYPLPGGMLGGSGVHKTRHQGPFSGQEKRLYGLYMRHFARAIEINMRLRIGESPGGVAPALVEALDMGMILVGEDRKIVQANRVADALLSGRRWLTAVDGRLRTVHHGSLGKFAWLVAEAARTGAGRGLSPGSVMRLRDGEGAILPVLIAPFRAEGGPWGALLPTATIMFRDPASGRLPSETAISEIFALSAAESRLVAMLSAGLTLTESARLAKISRNTAKTQLQSVFAKTGHSRQSQLVADVRANPLIAMHRN